MSNYFYYCIRLEGLYRCKITTIAYDAERDLLVTAKFQVYNVLGSMQYVQIGLPQQHGEFN